MTGLNLAGTYQNAKEESLLNRVKDVAEKVAPNEYSVTVSVAEGSITLKSEIQR